MEKGDVSIACEICITTDDAHELGNARKCLAGGFTHVVAVSPDQKRLDRLEKYVKKQVAATELERLRFHSPEALLQFVQDLEISRLKQESTVKGYKVKTSYRKLDAADAKDKRTAVSAVIATAIKRMKDKR